MSLDRTYADLALNRSVAEVDPFVADLIGREHERQRDKLILIPSESLTPKPVRDALASPFTSIYAEGYPSSAMIRDQEAALADLDAQLARSRRYGDRRYYRGNEFSNLVEALAQRRCAAVFANERITAGELFVNVQPLSGAAANNAVQEALLDSEDTIMGLALAHGGHLSHGAAVNRSGRRFNATSYRIPDVDSQLDYDDIAARAKRARPKLIIAGYTSYPWAPDWKRFRAIADDVGALLMADISHPAGLVAAGAFPSPVGIADVVTFTTHKTLFGPRGAVILSHRRDLMRHIDRSVFPGEQGGPHINKIAAMAVAFKLAAAEAFKSTQHQMTANAKVLSDALGREGVGVAYGGTNSHLLVLNLQRVGATGDLRGEPAVRMLDALGVVANRNSLPGDRGFAAPTGVRIGTPWLTQRGYVDEDMQVLANILARAFKAMHGVAYGGRRSPRYRGRMAYDAMHDIRGEVLAFARRGHAEGAPIAEVPPGSKSLLVVRGPRLLPFLDELSNRRLRDLEPGQARHVVLAGPPGHSGVNTIVALLPGTSNRTGLTAWVLIDAQRAEMVADWLQAASDGYVLVDPDEPSRKLSGPVTVTVGANAHPALIASTCLAKDAKRVDGGELDGVVPTVLDGMDVWLIRAGDAAAVVAKAHDIDALEIAMERQGLVSAPVPAAPPDDLSRPWFVGRRLAPASSEGLRPFEWEDPGDKELRRTPLHVFHAKRAKKLIPFAGWEMPVWYTNSSIESEHQAVRKTAGLFDVGHMGVFGVSGPDAGEFLDAVVTGNATRLPVGRAAYMYLLDANGRCMDDLILYRIEAERFMVVVNAANAQKNWAWLTGVNDGIYQIIAGDSSARLPVRTTLVDLRSPEAGNAGRVDLAFQGPESRDVLAGIVGSEDERRALAAMSANDVGAFTVAGAQVEIARTGYTGEAVGFEVFVHPEEATIIWDAILDAGDAKGVLPVGLGARDSTRTEAGFPLYGHELAGPLDLTPGDAGFGRFVKAFKPFFVGRDPYVAHEADRKSAVVRFEITDERVPMARQGDPATDSRGSWIGTVTSATRVADGRQIGMAYVGNAHTRRRTEFRVFAGVAARRPGRAQSPAELGPGGRYALPAVATVISRFR
jgi:glycine hydroxymethyltransferase